MVKGDALSYGALTPVTSLAPAPGPRPAARRQVFAVAAALLALALVAVAWVSTTPSQQHVGLESDGMLQPFYSWQSQEKDAELRDRHEQARAALQAKFQTPDFSTDLAEEDVKVGKGTPLKTEILAKFHTRDALKALQKRFETSDVPKEELAAAIAEDNVDIKSAKKNELVDEKKYKDAKTALDAYRSYADPILRRADRLYSRQTQIRQEGNTEATQANDEIAEGREEVQRAQEMKQDLLSGEKPVEEAQAEADEADKEYRHDALSYADAMVGAEKVSSDPKARAAAQNQLDTLRAKMAQAAAERRTAAHKLEIAQMSMHDDAGVQQYSELRSRGERDIRKGQELAGDAQEYQQRAALMQGRVKLAQSAAAKVQAKLQERRDAYSKSATELKQQENLAKSKLSNLNKSKAKLAALEKHEVLLRKAGAKLQANYQKLEADIRSREQARSEETAKIAAENSAALKSLLAQE